MRRLGPMLGACLWCASIASAQPGPRGPAELIGGARKARDARDLEQAGKRGTSAGKGEQPASEQTAPTADPHAADAPAQEAPHDAEHEGHAGLEGGPDRAPIATEHADPSLPDGTIRVRVRDASGAPAAAAEVSLGIMSADNTHTTRDTRTGADGSVVISGLTGGERQAYRVNVPYQGAKYSSSPFKLPPRGGYEVEIRRLPVTRDERLIVLYLGATSLELKDDRIKFVQEVQLLNLGGATYVFPEAGTLVPLPKGFMAVQTQESMTDQQIVEAKGEGVRVHGSLTPGQVTLLWGFDLPLEGSDAQFSFELPWITFSYRVICDAPSGMTLAVAEMPEPIIHTDAGRHFLITEIQRKVGDAPFRHLQITLRGIPGPGPLRFIAAALAACVLLGGVFLSRRTPRGAGPALAASEFEARKRELLERARELKAQRDTGETGPEYHQEQLTALTDELATLLFEQAETKRGSSQPRKS